MNSRVNSGMQYNDIDNCKCTEVVFSSGCFTIN